jgi:hypothetical protein
MLLTNWSRVLNLCDKSGIGLANACWFEESQLMGKTLNCEIGMLNLQELSRYYKGASFLPRLNNEIAKSHNENT